MMMISVIKKSCNRVSHQNGVISIGITSLILAIFGLIFFVVNYTQRHSNKLLHNKEEVNATVHLNMKEPVEVEDDRKDVYFFALSLLRLILCGIVSSILVLGAIKKRPRLLRPFLVYIAVNEVVVLVQLIIFIYTSFPTSPSGIVNIIAIIILMILGIFFWIVVFTFFKELKFYETMPTSKELDSDFQQPEKSHFFNVTL